MKIKDSIFMAICWICVGFATIVILCACGAMAPLRWLIEWYTRKSKGAKTLATILAAIALVGCSDNRAERRKELQLAFMEGVTYGLQQARKISAGEPIQFDVYEVSKKYAEDVIESNGSKKND